jgi:predicted permease
MKWIRRIGALFGRHNLSAENDEELRFHLSMLEETQVKAGLELAEARFAARRRFGNTTLLQERMHDADVLTFLESFLRDVRFAARMLSKHPGFTAIAVFALAIGIGVNTAVFTAYKAVLMERLDAKHPGELVNVYRTTAQDPYQDKFSYPDFEYYRDHNRVFSGLVATTGDELALSGVDGIGGAENSVGSAVAGAFGFRFPSVMHGGAEYVSAVMVSENYFSVLGVGAVRGRVFVPQDAHDLDVNPAVLMSENYWQRRFHGDIALLGKQVKLNGASFTVIGITPADFLGTNVNVPNFWLPMRLWPLLNEATDVLHDREDFCCALYGRLAPGASLLQAQAEMTGLAARLRLLHTPHSEGTKPITITLYPGSHVRPFSVKHDPGLAFAILLIMGAVGLVLLIACANVASLQLARSAARQREIGVRLSLGAGRSRIIRQLLTESALLGMLAGGASMLMAWFALRLLMIEVAASLPMEWGNIALHVEPDAHVFGYVFTVSLIAGILFGLAPALESSRPDLSSALKDEGARFAFRLRNARLRDLLVGLQVAASLFLLIGAGLLIRGSIRATAISPGYESKKVIWMNINFPAGFNFTHARQLAEIRALRSGLRNVPGVRSVSSGNAPDGGGLRNARYGVDGAKPPDTDSPSTVYYSYVESNYFDTLGIPLLRGRSFAENANGREATVVVSEAAARELWPGQDPIGRTLTLDGSHEFHANGELVPTGTPYQVISVVKSTRGVIPGEADAKKVYLPLPSDRIDDVSLLVRCNGDPKQIIRELGKQVQLVDKNLVVYAETLDGLLTSTPIFVISRLSALFATIIGVLGLLLACVGICGTVNYAVVRRTREIGIRMALGARRSDVLRLILGESGRPVLIGVLVGLLAAAAASRVLRALLFGLSAFDPWSFAGIGISCLFIALVAAYVPARQAATVDPMIALRCE